MKKLEIDLGLIIAVEVPDDMSDYDVCDGLYKLLFSPYKENPRGSFLFTIKDEFAIRLSGENGEIKFSNEISAFVKRKGDTRTTGQISIDQEEHRKQNLNTVWN